MIHKKMIVSLCSGIACLANAAFAADVTKNRDIVLESMGEEYADNYKIDLALPDAVGFSLVGRKSDGMAGGQLSRDWYFDVAAEQDGKVPSMALAGRPYWVWFGNRVSDYKAQTPGKKYVKSRLERILARTTLSFASLSETASKQSSIKVGRIGLGFQSSLLDATDPRLDADHLSCLGRVRASVESSRNVVKTYWEQELRPALVARGGQADMIVYIDKLAELPDFTSDKLISIKNINDLTSRNVREELADRYARVPTDAVATKAREVCMTQAAKNYTKKVDLYFGAGVAYRGEGDSLRHLSREATSVWAGYVQPLPTSEKYPVRFQIQARMADNRTFVIGKTPAGENLERTGRETVFLAGFADDMEDWGWGVTVSSHHEAYDEAGLSDLSYTRYVVRGHKKLTDKVAVEVQIGMTDKEVFENGDFTIVRLTVSN